MRNTTNHPWKVAKTPENCPQNAHLPRREEVGVASEEMGVV